MRKVAQKVTPVLQVGEARAELPGLVRSVARGGSPVRIGPRGKAAAVLVGVDEYERLRAAQELAAPVPVSWPNLGLVWVGEDGIDDGLVAQHRESVAIHQRELERTERFILTGPPPRRRRR